MSVPCHPVPGESKTPTPAPSLQQWPHNLLNRDLEPPLETEKGLGQPGYPSATAGGVPVTCQPSQNPPEPRKIGATLGRGSAGPIYLAPPARRSPTLSRAAQPLPARAGHPAGWTQGWEQDEEPPGAGHALAPAPERGTQRPHEQFLQGGGGSVIQKRPDFACPLRQSCPVLQRAPSWGQRVPLPHLLLAAWVPCLCLPLASSWSRTGSP